MNTAKLDFLRELGNIGVGHATTALSTMLHGKMFRLSVPDARMLPFEEASNFIGGLDKVVTGIFVQVSGDLDGYMAFVLPLESGITLVELLTGIKSVEATDVFDEMGISALEEMGNVMISSYLNALSSMTNLVLIPSVPGVAIDMAGAVWQSIFAGAEITSEATLIKTDFWADGVQVVGHIVFLPNEGESYKLSHALGLEEL